MAFRCVMFCAWGPMPSSAIKQIKSLKSAKTKSHHIEQHEAKSNKLIPRHPTKPYPVTPNQTKAHHSTSKPMKPKRNKHLYISKTHRIQTHQIAPKHIKPNQIASNHTESHHIHHKKTKGHHAQPNQNNSYQVRPRQIILNQNMPSQTKTC